MITLFTAKEPAPQGNKGQPKVGPPRKRGDKILCGYFVITPLAGGGMSVSCKHCSKFIEAYLERLNPTKAPAYLTDHCTGIDVDTKRKLL